MTTTENAINRPFWESLSRLITAIRQNHALEHATIHVLSQRHPGIAVMGRSTPTGFYLYGQAPTALVASATAEALARLQAGERSLAIHPRCGTNLAVSAVLAGIGAMLAMSRRRRPWYETAPNVFLAVTIGLFLAQPVGYSVQERITTIADLSNVHIAGITQQWAGGQMVHRIDLTRD